MVQRKRVNRGRFPLPTSWMPRKSRMPCLCPFESRNSPPKKGMNRLGNDIADINDPYLVSLKFSSGSFRDWKKRKRGKKKQRGRRHLIKRFLTARDMARRKCSFIYSFRAMVVAARGRARVCVINDAEKRSRQSSRRTRGKPPHHWNSHAVHLSTPRLPCEYANTIHYSYT